MEIKVDFGNKRTITGIVILACIIAIAFYSPNIIALTNPTICTIDGICQHEERLKLITNLIPIFIATGIIIGAMVFFLMSTKIENKQKELSKITEALISFLNKEEKIVVKKLIENDGKILQSEISRTQGIGKVKSHRILQRLIDRGVIEKQDYGKTNYIILNKNIKDTILVKK